MTPDERAQEAARLRSAIDKQAADYGTTCMRYGMATMAPEIARANQEIARQYEELMGLTAALAQLATEAR